MGDEAVPDRELFIDDRGSILRASWDAEHRRVVLGVWRDGRCVATQHLAGPDVVRLSALLTQAWVDSIRQELAT